MIKYLVEEQEHRDTSNVIHKGKKVSAYIDDIFAGKTGYIDCNYKDKGFTAKLFLFEGYGIFVEEKMRGKHVGQDLIYKLINEAASDGYGQFIVRCAVPRAKKFYDDVFLKLKKDGKISVLKSTTCKLGNIEFLRYEALLV